MVFKLPQVVDESLVKFKCYQKSNYTQLKENHSRFGMLRH